MIKSQTVVIARYSAVTMPLFLALAGVMAGCCIWGGLDSGHPVLIWAGVLFGLTIPMSIFLLIFWRGRAIQIKDGQLIYRLLVPRGVPHAEMEDAHIEVMYEGMLPIKFPQKMIALKRRGGGTVCIPAWLLSEDAEVVVARIRHARCPPKAA
jgi:hypothetical protein